eukprot:PhM_4_TR3143/c0_g1_i2/m.86779
MTSKSVQLGADIRITLRKLDDIAAKTGGTRRLDGDHGPKISDVDLERMTPYRRQQYLIASDMKHVRDGIARLDLLESGTQSSSATERAQVSLSIRKGMNSLKDKMKPMQKMAQSEGCTEMYHQLKSHVEKTERLYKDRFRPGTEIPGGGDDVSPGGGANEPLLRKSGGGVGGGVGGGGSYGSNAEYMDLREDPEFVLFFEQTRAADRAMDDALGRIQEGTGRLKETALQIGGELKHQKRMMDDVEHKVDRIQVQMVTLNGKLKRTIKRVDQDKMLVYLICCFILLGVGGFVLYEAKVVKN